MKSILIGIALLALVGMGSAEVRFTGFGVQSNNQEDSIISFYVSDAMSAGSTLKFTYNSELGSSKVTQTLKTEVSGATNYPEIQSYADSRKSNTPYVLAEQRIMAHMSQGILIRSTTLNRDGTFTMSEDLGVYDSNWFLWGIDGSYNDNTVFRYSLPGQGGFFSYGMIGGDRLGNFWFM